MTLHIEKISVMLSLLALGVVFQTSAQCRENYSLEATSLHQQGDYEGEIAVRQKLIDLYAKAGFQDAMLDQYVRICEVYFENLHQPAKALAACEFANDNAKLDSTGQVVSPSTTAEAVVMFGVVREAVDGSDQSGVIREAFYSWPMGSLQDYLYYLQARKPAPQAEIQSVQQFKEISDGLFSTLKSDQDQQCGSIDVNQSPDETDRKYICRDAVAVLRYHELITSTHKDGIQSFDGAIANEIHAWENDIRDDVERIRNSDNPRNQDSGNSILKFAGMLVAGLITVKTGNTELANGVAMAAGNSQADASAMESQLLDIKNIVQEYRQQQNN